jgi:hypothetical protein
MKLDDVVTVYCTDLDKSVEGVIVRIGPEKVSIDITGLLLNFNKIKNNVYVANHSGMEFVYKS